MIVSLDRRVTEPPSRRSAHWELSRAPCRPTGRCPAVRKGKEAVHPQGQDPALRHMVTAAGLLCPRPLGRASLHTRARRGGDRTGSEHSPRARRRREPEGRSGHARAVQPLPEARARTELARGRRDARTQLARGRRDAAGPVPLRPCQAPRPFTPTASGHLRPSAFPPRPDPALTLRDSLREPQPLSTVR